MDRGNYYSGCQARDSSSGGRTAPGHEDTLLWKGRILVCGGEDRSARDQILLCEGEDTSRTDPDPALWWKGNVSWYWHIQDVRVVREALPKDVQRQSAESQVDSQSCQAQDVRAVWRQLKEFFQSLPRLISLLPARSRREVHDCGQPVHHCRSQIC